MPKPPPPSNRQQPRNPMTKPHQHICGQNIPRIFPAFSALILYWLAAQTALASSTATNGVDTSQAHSRTNAPATNAPPSKFFDPQDGWFDVSSFLSTAYGFIPLVLPITEPAVGYGAGAGLIFINRSEAAPGQPPPPGNFRRWWRIHPKRHLGSIRRGFYVVAGWHHPNQGGNF